MSEGKDGNTRPLESLNNAQLHVVWEALSQFSENQVCDPATGEEIENPILDDLVERLDNYIAGRGEG